MKDFYKYSFNLTFTAKQEKYVNHYPYRIIIVSEICDKTHWAHKNMSKNKLYVLYVFVTELIL